MKRRGLIARTAGLALVVAKLGIDVLGVKKATELWSERRRPRRRPLARLGTPLVAAAALGGMALVGRDRIGDLVAKITGSPRSEDAPSERHGFASDSRYAEAPTPEGQAADPTIDLRERPAEST
jgi:hypothetical protein